jgi:hypothetical protein
MIIIVTLIVGISLFVYMKREIKKINSRIDNVEKLLPDEAEYKKHKEDVKTLYKNQTMLLSLVNAVRVRINNFYAKKLKEPRFKTKGFESTKEFGETHDGV